MKHMPLLKKQAAALVARCGIRPRAAAKAATALHDAGMLAWPATIDPSGLPYGLTVRSTAAGAEVDAYLVVRALVKALASECVEDPEGVAEELAVIDGARGPELDALLDELIERLGGAEIRYPASTARELAARIERAAGPMLVPMQRKAAG
ncbi:hypothetical protein [Kitasatospora sp. CB01950]|uniref:hypothetical protein n=1 Tax=Kitasatospora sp. CB01950 TaxID=1703930 RepID=UPI00093D8A9E|nr:hypothetical protein [Kitasatospora sp. CB01950]